MILIILPNLYAKSIGALINPHLQLLDTPRVRACLIRFLSVTEKALNSGHHRFSETVSAIERCLLQRYSSINHFISHKSRELLKKGVFCLINMAYKRNASIYRY